MNNQISNKISFVLVLILVLFFGNYIFENTIGKTLELKKEYEELLELSTSEIDYSSLLVRTNKQLEELDKLIIDENKHAGQIQQVIMEQIEDLKLQYNVSITKMPAPHQYQLGNYIVLTEVFELEGTYKNLLRLINELELKFEQANLSSLNFELKRDFTTNKNKLYATIYFQNIKKNE